MKDRFFTITWDNSMQRRRTGRAIEHTKAQHKGAHFATGVVALDNGLTYDNMHELHENFESIGKVRIKYDGEGEV